MALSRSHSFPQKSCENVFTTLQQKKRRERMSNLCAEYGLTHCADARPTITAEEENCIISEKRLVEAMRRCREERKDEQINFHLSIIHSNSCAGSG